MDSQPMMTFVLGFASGIACAIAVAWMAAHMDGYYQDDWK